MKENVDFFPKQFDFCLVGSILYYKSINVATKTDDHFES